MLKLQKQVIEFFPPVWRNPPAGGLCHLNKSKAQVPNHTCNAANFAPWSEKI